MVCTSLDRGERNEVEIPLQALFRRFSNGGFIPETPAEIIIRGESISSRVRKKARVANFGLPEELDQSSATVNALSALEGVLLPDFEDADYVYVERVIALLDEVLASALTSPGEVRWPPALAELEWIDKALNEGCPPLEVLGMLLRATRIFLWLRGRCPGTGELIGSFLDLEDGYHELMEYVRENVTANATHSSGAQPKSEPLRGFPVKV